MSDDEQMHLSCSAHLLVEEEVPFFTKINQRTTVKSLQVSASAPLTGGESYCVWALCTPSYGRLPADMAYATVSPFILGGFTATGADHDSRGVYTVPVTNWQLEPGTTLFVHVAAASAGRESVGAELAAAKRCAANAAADTVVRPRPSRDAAASGSPRFTVRLCGSMLPVLVGDDQAEWSPFIVHRWFELKDSSVGEATFVFRPAQPPTVEGRPIVPAEAVASYFTLLPGAAKEAAGVDEERAYVKWMDGSIGLMPELQSYFHFFTPARREKVARVRRFPHRHADIVGEISFGLEVTAIGLQRDPFTGEAYALVALPGGPEFAHLPAAHDLRNLSAGQWLWGWSKVAGRSGLPLLSDVTPEAQRAAGPSAHLPPPPPASRRPDRALASGAVEGEALPCPTYYTPARPNKPVRIRKKPTLRAEVIGQVEPNEVREAVRIVTVPPAGLAAATRGRGRTGGPGKTAAVPDTDGSPAHFVEWRGGGYSALSNATQEFLRQIRLSAEPPRLSRGKREREE